MASPTTLKIVNESSEEVLVYLTLGAAAGSVQNVGDIPFITTVVNPLQGSFSLAAGESVSYTPPEGTGIDGNLAFGTPPLNCPTDDFPNGVNIAEFNLDNEASGDGAQETVDISCVAGVHSLLTFTLSGGGTWNAGSTQPSVTGFSNRELNANCGRVGVYPYGCDCCTSRRSPPSCPGPPPPPPFGDCQQEPICNVQRDASECGGTVEVAFGGLVES